MLNVPTLTTQVTLLAPCRLVVQCPTEEKCAESEPQMDPVQSTTHNDESVNTYLMYDELEE